MAVWTGLPEPSVDRHLGAKSGHPLGKLRARLAAQTFDPRLKRLFRCPMQPLDFFGCQFLCQLNR